MSSSKSAAAMKNSVGMEFSRIPAINGEEPFELGVTVVTQKQWKEVMGSLPEGVKNEQPDHPITYVSFWDVVEFLKKLSEKEGVEYRLPTEEEWEHACRGGTDTTFHFGDDESELGDWAVYYDNSGGELNPVATKKPNQFGLYDMHGNVWEWCDSVY